ncbi:MAG: hypothetical protein ABFC96_06935 [Thermoguttaceae bacterium]
MKVLFLHGWRSTLGGLEPTYLKDHGHTVLHPALPDDDFEESVRIAQAEFDREKPDAVVGSGRGGAVAMNIKAGHTPLVLLCPAWKRWGNVATVKPGTIILHAWADEAVPFADSEELVSNSRLPPSILIEVGREHRLADEESLARMLEAVAKACAPIQFGISDLLVITALYAILFGILRSFDLSPLAFAIVALGFTAVGLGQTFLFKGQRPRKASMIVGACYYVAVGGAFRLAYGPTFYFDPVGGAWLGASFGYVAGLLVSGTFFVVNRIRKNDGQHLHARPQFQHRPWR